MATAGTYIEANGIRVYYEVYGEGEPLLLIHGGTATSRAWASHLPAFTEHFRVFTPDSRGHGRTDNPTGELDYRVMADDVAALVSVLGLQRPLVLGYSDGGQIALELGMRYPGLARALVLGGAQFGFSEAYLEAVRALLGITGSEEMEPEKLDSWESPAARRWNPRNWSGSSPSGLPSCARRTGTCTAPSTGRRM